MANEVVLFIDADLHGAHKHIYDQEPNLNAGDDNGFNDQVSSLAVLSGNWQFFADSNFNQPYPPILGPGIYRFVGNVGIKNDDLSSLRSTDSAATVQGEPLTAHALLFQHANFHGDHRHVFTAEIDLTPNGFNDTTSSVVVEQGNWAFFRDSQFDGQFPPVLGPGAYSFVGAIGITNDEISSLSPTDAAPTLPAPGVSDELVLFVNGQFHGSHKHVFGDEPNLNAADDNSFNDQVSSIFVERGTWAFYRDAGFIGEYAPQLGPGPVSFVGDVGITNDDLSSLRPAPALSVTPGTPISGHVILFEHANFHGAHKHVFNSEPNLAAADDVGFNDITSSIAVLNGNWIFFRNSNLDDEYPAILGPGLYSFVESFGIRNDDISSLQVTDRAANRVGAPLGPHLILFEHGTFHGAHKHVFTDEPNLNATDDSSFNDSTSSIIVLAGNWATFADSDFGRPYRPVIGPGLYSFVETFGIKNDDLSSLRPVANDPTVTAPPAAAQVLLFINANFHGAHKHVFADEPNLNAANDSAFNDQVSSLAVLQNNWSFFRDANFQRQYDTVLGGGLFSFVGNVGITNDDMSSLRVAGLFIRFAGTATFRLDDSRTPNPFSRASSVLFNLHTETGVLNILNFGDINFGTFSTKVGDDTISLVFDGAADGSFDSATGDMLVPSCQFTIHHTNSSPFISDSSVTVNLTTGSATSPGGKFTDIGSPADAGGKIVLVGATVVSGGNFNGEQAAIRLEGVIMPRP